MISRVPSWAYLIYILHLKRVSNGDILLLTHLGPLIFTSYARTYILSFLYKILGFLGLIVNKMVSLIVNYVSFKWHKDVKV